MDNRSVDEKKWLCAKKNECGQKKMSVLRASVTVECGVWTLDYESAVSGEPPPDAHEYTRDGKNQGEKDKKSES